jgi:hypothetical protein
MFRAIDAVSPLALIRIRTHRAREKQTPTVALLTNWHQLSKLSTGGLQRIASNLSKAAGSASSKFHGTPRGVLK